MRPAHKSISAGVWIVREQADSNYEAALTSIRTWSFDRYRFAEANLDSQLPFHSQKGERYNFMSTTLYVGNLAFETTSQDLNELFAQAGTVQSANVIEDRDTGRSRGFAFVEMSSNEEAAAAIDQFNGREVGGRALKVNEAKPRENRGGGRGFGGNNNGFRSNRGGNQGGTLKPRW